MYAERVAEYMTEVLIPEDLYDKYRGYYLFKRDYTFEEDGYRNTSFWFTNEEGDEICSFYSEEEMLDYIDKI